MVHFWVKNDQKWVFYVEIAPFLLKIDLNWIFLNIPACSCVRQIVLLLTWRSISYFLCLFLFTYLLFIIFYLLTNEKQMTSTFQNSIKSTLCAGPLSLMVFKFLWWESLLTLVWPLHGSLEVTWGHFEIKINFKIGHFIRKNK